MKDLSALPTATLAAMKARLTNWIVYIAVIDIVVLGGFVWFAIGRPPAQVVPLVPIVMLPAIAVIPVLIRAGAVRRELERRRQ